jgi:hypothetical protein
VGRRLSDQDGEREGKAPSDLTVGEFDALMDLMMQKMLEKIEELFFDLEQQLPDPDEGWSSSRRWRSGSERRCAPERRIPIEDVKRELGID